MKRANFDAGQPLVSVVMPAYKTRYLEQALGSVLGQTYRPLELVICDDSTTPDVERIVDAFRAEADFPVIYQRNAVRLWETRSAAKGIGLASGQYVKFLHDDDVLLPRCIESLVEVMEADSSVVLASSRRRLVGEEGETLPDIPASVFPFPEDVIVNGEDLISFLAEHTLNFIGEPSAVMCRRSDLLPFGDELSVLNGVRITWIADLALYVKLLKKGHLAMLADVLTEFRVSREQFSQYGRDRPGVGEQAHVDFRQAIRDLGWHREQPDRTLVAVAPITRLSRRIFKQIDILAAVHRALGYSDVSLSGWLAARTPSAPQMQLINQRLQAFSGGPRILVLIADPLADAAAVTATRNSVEQISLYQQTEVQVLSVAKNELVPAINCAAETSSASWLVLVDAGSTFTPSGLLMIALELLEAPPLQAIYADELTLDEGSKVGILLRPDFNLDLLLSVPASMARHWLFHRETLLAAGGFDTDLTETFELAFLLMLIERHGLGGLGHVSEPLLTASSGVLADSPEECEVIERHLRSRGYARSRVETGSLPGRYQVEYGHGTEPGVSILVLVQDDLAQARRCVETLLENTRYPFYEILLLDHGSLNEDICQWLVLLEQLGEQRIRIHRFSRDVTPACVRNQGAQLAKGDYLLCLGAGAGVIQDNWLQQLLNHAQRPEVGVVGCKLLSADGRIHHAGLLLGLKGTVGKPFLGAAPDSAGYMHRLQVEQNFSALSGECFILRKSLFSDIGGFDEQPLLSGAADVDLCLRVREAGFLNVWTPRASLLMDVQKPALPSRQEEDALYQRWLPALASDPAYNPGFSLQDEPGFRLAGPHLCWRPLQSWRPLPTVLAHPSDLHGCGHYRVIQPFRALRQASKIDGVISSTLLQMPEMESFKPDVIIYQRQFAEQRLESMRRTKSFSRAFSVFELDDYLPNLPLKSLHRQHMPKDILKTLRTALDHADRFVVSTDALADAFAGLHDDIRVIRNRLPVLWWDDLRGARNVGKKPRVGWAGGASHTGDLSIISEVVKALANEVDWIFLGMCPDNLRPYVREFHPGVEIDSYPAKLASLDLDVAVAPVEQNLFNECKSNLRLLEYGACGFPVICSDVLCYEGSLPVTRVKNRYRDWVDAIRSHTSDVAHAARMGDRLQSIVRKEWMLKGQYLDDWLQGWLPD